MATLKARIQFYRSLATMESAGVPLLRSLKQRHSPGFSRVAREMARSIEGGKGHLSEIMQHYPKLFTPIEYHLVRLGEQTGNLEKIFTSLVGWYEGQMRLKRQLVSGLVYPAMQYHAAAILIPVIQFFLNQGTICRLTTGIVTLSCAPYVLLFLIRVLLPAVTPSFIRNSTALESLYLAMPVLGTLSRKINFYRFFLTWSIALKSGLSAAPAVSLASSTCSSRLIRSKLQRVSEIMAKANCPFSEAFVKAWPRGDRDGVILNMVETGEKSGHLDETTARLAALYQEETEQAFGVLGKVVPVLVYLVIAGYIAYQIISFWSQLMGNVNQLL